MRHLLTAIVALAASLSMLAPQVLMANPWVRGGIPTTTMPNRGGTSSFRTFSVPNRGGAESTAVPSRNNASHIRTFSVPNQGGASSIRSFTTPNGGGPSSVRTLAVPNHGGQSGIRTLRVPSHGSEIGTGSWRNGGTSTLEIGGNRGNSGGGTGHGGIHWGIRNGGISIGTGQGRLPIEIPVRIPGTGGWNGGRVDEEEENRWVRPERNVRPWQPVQPLPPRVEPQPRFEPRPQRIPEVRPNVLPEIPALPPTAVNPEANQLVLTGRQITGEEIARAKNFFHQRLTDLAKRIEGRLPPAEFNAEQVLQQMVAHKVPAAKQIQIIEALKQGDYETARRLWLVVLPRVQIPFRPCRARQIFIKIWIAIERRTLTCVHVRELIRCLRTYRTYTVQAEACCGADDLLAQLEQEVWINQAIDGIPAENADGFDKPEEHGKPNGHGKPDQESTLTSYGKPDNYGKTDQYSSPGQAVPLPTGQVNIVYHPKLPDRKVVVVNSQTVMIGTGGQGVFRVERGYVAEALGNKTGNGTPLAGNHSELVRSGIVIANPTPAKVSFVIDNREIMLESGFQRTLHTSSSKTISFDQGDGRKTIRYVLKPGTFRFDLGEEGLNLGRMTYKVVVSNRGNLETFNYILQGQPATVGPEDTNTHASDYPIIIRFDRGNGTDMKQVRFDKRTGKLQLAINPNDNLWDLYETSGVTNSQKSVLRSKPDFVPAF